MNTQNIILGSCMVSFISKVAVSSMARKGKKELHDEVMSNRSTETKAVFQKATELREQAKPILEAEESYVKASLDDFIESYKKTNHVDEVQEEVISGMKKYFRERKVAMRSESEKDIIEQAKVWQRKADDITRKELRNISTSDGLIRHCINKKIGPRAAAGLVMMPSAFAAIGVGALIKADFKIAKDLYKGLLEVSNVRQA